MITFQGVPIHFTGGFPMRTEDVKRVVYKKSSKDAPDLAWVELKDGTSILIDRFDHRNSIDWSKIPHEHEGFKP